MGGGGDGGGGDGDGGGGLGNPRCEHALHEASGTSVRPDVAAFAWQQYEHGAFT